MAAYVGRMLHGRSGAEVDHPFEGPDDLMERSPVKVMRFFMEHAVSSRAFHEHEDYEIFSALRHRQDGETDVVTVIGDFLYTPTSRSPFVCMIAPAG
jgi:hypothetical protein